ncbi:universal stress protein [Desulfosarcina alkanivorans]
MSEMGKELELAGFNVRSIIKTGYPWRKILELEEREAPSILVIGSHGRSNVSDMLLGSVSDRVVRKCK